MTTKDLIVRLICAAGRADSLEDRDTVQAAVKVIADQDAEIDRLQKKCNRMCRSASIEDIKGG